MGARERTSRLGPAHPDRRRRRELRGAAERRGRRRRAAAEVAERRRPAHGRRCAAHRHRARRRGAASGARGCGLAAGRRSASCAHRTARARGSSSRCRTVLPLVILRGSGETTAALAREAATHGVRTLAHAEGGGVLYIGAAADPAKAEALVEASLDRLGVCNRLNLLLVDRAAKVELGPVLERLGIAVREPERLGHEWANDSEHIASVTVRDVDSLEEAVGIANRETSGLAASIVTEDEEAAQRFLARLPRHGGVLERDDAIHRRLRAHRLAGDGHQRRSRAGSARAGHLPRPLPAAVPRRRRRNAAPVKRPLVVKLGSSLVVDERGRPRRALLRAARGGDRRDRRGRHAGLRRVVGCDRARPAPARAREAAVEPAAAAGRVGARSGCAAARLAGRARAARRSRSRRSCSRAPRSASAART